MNLTQLKQGDKAKIKDLSSLDWLLKQRMVDLGLTEGREVCMKCQMPFGGPLMIEVCGQCISLRRKEASFIGVEA